MCQVISTLGTLYQGWHSLLMVILITIGKQRTHVVSRKNIASTKCVIVLTTVFTEQHQLSYCTYDGARRFKEGFKITGRVKDVIAVGKGNYYYFPSELESCLVQ